MDIINTVKTVYNAILDKKGDNVTVLDINKLSVVSDYFILASGNNPTHVKTLADAAEDALSKIGRQPNHIEGRQSANWILLDYSDFIIHVFTKEQREFYNLEHIWGDADLVEF